MISKNSSNRQIQSIPNSNSTIDFQQQRQLQKSIQNDQINLKYGQNKKLMQNTQENSFESNLFIDPQIIQKQVEIQESSIKKNQEENISQNEIQENFVKQKTENMIEEIQMNKNEKQRNISNIQNLFFQPKFLARKLNEIEEGSSKEIKYIGIKTGFKSMVKQALQNQNHNIKQKQSLFSRLYRQVQPQDEILESENEDLSGKHNIQNKYSAQPPLIQLKNQLMQKENLICKKNIFNKLKIAKQKLTQYKDFLSGPKSDSNRQLIKYSILGSQKSFIKQDEQHKQQFVPQQRPSPQQNMHFNQSIRDLFSIIPNSAALRQKQYELNSPFLMKNNNQIESSAGKNRKSQFSNQKRDSLRSNTSSFYKQLGSALIGKNKRQFKIQNDIDSSKTFNQLDLLKQMEQIEKNLKKNQTYDEQTIKRNLLMSDRLNFTRQERSIQNYQNNNIIQQKLMKRLGNICQRSPNQTLSFNQQNFRIKKEILETIDIIEENHPIHQQKQYWQNHLRLYGSNSCTNNKSKNFSFEEKLSLDKKFKQIEDRLKCKSQKSTNYDQLDKNRYFSNNYLTERYVEQIRPQNLSFQQKQQTFKNEAEIIKLKTIDKSINQSGRKSYVEEEQDQFLMNESLKKQFQTKYENGKKKPQIDEYIHTHMKEFQNLININDDFNNLIVIGKKKFDLEKNNLGKKQFRSSNFQKVIMENDDSQSKLQFSSTIKMPGSLIQSTIQQQKQTIKKPEKQVDDIIAKNFDLKQLSRKGYLYFPQLKLNF